MDSLFILILILCSAFFSGTETAILSSNRYRLLYLAKSSTAARHVIEYLKCPERFLGVVLVGNNVANIAVSSLVTVLTINYFGEGYVPASTMVLAFVVLVFAEVLPKTLATQYSEKLAIRSVSVIRILEWVLAPILMIINNISRIFIPSSVEKSSLVEKVKKEDIRQMVNVDSADLSHQDQQMLMGLLDLDQLTVNDIMIPKIDVVGIDISWSWEKIQLFLGGAKYSQYLVYRQGIDDVLGCLFVSDVIRLLIKGAFNKNSLVFSLKPVIFVPEGTAVLRQIMNFQKNHEVTWSVVVDEYGDVCGAISIHDIVEEIVGHYRESNPMKSGQIIRKGKGFLVDAQLSVRDVNRLINFQLPVSGPNTVSGMVLEYLEAIPQGAIGLVISGFYIEVVEVSQNRVELVYVERVA
jgi:Mg2+/Co2+ transporter CorB